MDAAESDSAESGADSRVDVHVGKRALRPGMVRRASLGNTLARFSDFILISNRSLPEPAGYRTSHTFEDGQRLLVRGSVTDLEHGIICGVTLSRMPLTGREDVSQLISLFSRHQFTGHFAVCTAINAGVAVITDPLGSVPVYAADGVIGSDAFDVARTAGRLDIDRVAMAEFLQEGVVTSPFTIFEALRLLPPGTILEIGTRTVREHLYWLPAEVSGEVSESAIDEIADHAAEVMRSNLETLMRDFPRSLLFYSGGEDSRALGRMIQDCGNGRRVHGDLIAVTFLDHVNREFRLASLSAELLGLELEVRWRSQDHYIQDIPQLARAIGPGYRIDYAHAFGLVDSDEANIFIDGWTADSFLKAHFHPQTRRHIGRLPIGLYRPCSAFDQDLSGDVTGPLVDAVRERRSEKIKLVRNFRNTDAEVWAKMWPITDHCDYSYFASNIALRPSVSPFMLGNFVDVIRQLPDRVKVNRRLFYRMFGRHMGLAGLIPRSGGEIPRLPPLVNVPVEAVSRAAFGAHRGLRRVVGLPPKDQGPWQSAEVRAAAAMKASMMMDRDALREAIDLRAARTSVRTVSELDPGSALRVLQVASLIQQGEISVAVR
jgi:hypothetical protein